MKKKYGGVQLILDNVGGTFFLTLCIVMLRLVRNQGMSSEEARTMMISNFGAKQNAHKQHREYALKCVTEKREHTRFRPECPQHVRCPGISAPIISYIDSMQLSI